MKDRRDGAFVPLLAVFLAAMAAAWALGIPPGAGPDESQHYVKALGVGGGDLYGASPGDVAEGPPGAGIAGLRALDKAAQSAEGRRQLEALFQAEPTKGELWQRRTSRVFTVPAGLSFSAFGCGYITQNDWRCLNQGQTSPVATDGSTYVGTYQPFVYAVPGLVMRAANEPQTAMRFGRVANAALSLGLLALAALLLWDGLRALSLVGLLVAVTPAILFFASILNPSGPELTSAICFSAALLRLTRAPSQPKWVWAACAASGAVLAVSRSLGPVFVALLVVAVVALVGRSRAAAGLRSARKPAVVAAAIITIACLAGAVWERAYQPHVPWGPRAILDGLSPSMEVLPDLPKQAVGVFGGLDIFMPVGFYVIWWVMLAVLLAAALYLGSWSERVSLAGLAIAIVVATLMLSAVYRQIGYELQGRYILPFAVLLPLWAGELIRRHAERISRRMRQALIGSLAAGAAVVHAAAWYTHGRYVSVGEDGSWLFPPDAGWIPPLGWWALTGVALLATCAYMCAAWIAATTRTEAIADHLSDA